MAFVQSILYRENPEAIGVPIRMKKWKNTIGELIRLENIEQREEMCFPIHGNLSSDGCIFR